MTGKWGVWESFSGKGSNGTPMCGISTAPTADRTVARSVAVKRFWRAKYLTIDIFKQSWDFQKGSTVDVSLSVDTGNVVVLHAYANGPILDLRTTYIADFLSSLAEGKFLFIGFPNQHEDGWGVALNGSRSAVLEMDKCMQAMESGG